MSDITVRSPYHNCTKTTALTPVKQRIKFKILTLTYNCLYNPDYPQYLKNLLTLYQPSRSLRSADLMQLTVPDTKTKLGDKSFSVAAPYLWNSLPNDIKQASTFLTFRRQLKTYLFREAYD